MIDRFKELRLRPVVAVELEFYLVDQNRDGVFDLVDGVDPDKNKNGILDIVEPGGAKFVPGAEYMTLKDFNTLYKQWDTYWNPFARTRAGGPALRHRHEVGAAADLDQGGAGLGHGLDLVDETGPHQLEGGGEGEDGGIVRKRQNAVHERDFRAAAAALSAFR